MIKDLLMVMLSLVEFSAYSGFVNINGSVWKLTMILNWEITARALLRRYF